MKSQLLTFTLTFVFGLCAGQELREYVGHYTLKNRVKKDTLIDNELKMKFILDSARINITAQDFLGNRFGEPILGVIIRLKSIE